MQAVSQTCEIEKMRPVPKECLGVRVPLIQTDRSNDTNCTDSSGVCGYESTPARGSCVPFFAIYFMNVGRRMELRCPSELLHQTPRGSESMSYLCRSVPRIHPNYHTS